MLATEVIYPDFQEVLRATKEQLPAYQLRFIKAGIPNGPAVARHLALNPAECEKLRDLDKRGFKKQSQQHIERISDQLLADGAASMGHDPYHVYRQKRYMQQKSRV